MMNRFHYLKVGLGLVLAFVGAKMVLADVYKIPIAVSLSVIAGLLATSVVASLLRPEPCDDETGGTSDPTRVA